MLLESHDASAGSRTPLNAYLARVVELMAPVVCELSIADLAEQWLAEFEAVVLRLRLTPGEQARYDAAVAVFREVFDSFRRISRQGRWSDFVAMASRSVGGQRALAAFRDSRRLTSFPEAKRAALGELLARHRGNRILVSLRTFQRNARWRRCPVISRSTS